MEGSVRYIFAFLGCVWPLLAPSALAEDRHRSGGFSNSSALPSESVLNYNDSNIPHETLRMPASRGAMLVKPAARAAMAPAAKTSGASVADVGREIEQDEDDSRKAAQTSAAAPSFQAPKLNVTIPPVSILPRFTSGATATPSSSDKSAPPNFANFIAGTGKAAGEGNNLNLGLTSVAFGGTDALGKLKFGAGFKLSVGGSLGLGTSSTPYSISGSSWGK